VISFAPIGKVMPSAWVMSGFQNLLFFSAVVWRFCKAELVIRIGAHWSASQQ
jgi:hypothetical protein